MSEPHLRLSKVHRHFGKDETLVRVLEAADLEVKTGELVAIVAPSGAGKSTLLHLGGLLERPQSGEIEIMGTPTMQLSERAARCCAAPPSAMSISSTTCCRSSRRSRTSTSRS